MTLVIGKAMANPRMSLWAIAPTRANAGPHPRGGRQWSASSVKHFLDQAARVGLALAQLRANWGPPLQSCGPAYSRRTNHRAVEPNFDPPGAQEVVDIAQKPGHKARLDLESVPISATSERVGESGKGRKAASPLDPELRVPACHFRTSLVDDPDADDVFRGSARTRDRTSGWEMKKFCFHDDLAIFDEA